MTVITIIVCGIVPLIGAYLGYKTGYSNGAYNANEDLYEIIASYDQLVESYASKERDKLGIKLGVH